MAEGRVFETQAVTLPLISNQVQNPVWLTFHKFVTTYIHTGLLLHAVNMHRCTFSYRQAHRGLPPYGALFIGRIRTLTQSYSLQKVQVIKVSCGRYLTHSNVIVAASEPLVTISDRTLTNYSVLQLSRFWLLDCLAGMTRLELATTGVTGLYSNQLNYIPFVYTATNRNWLLCLAVALFLSKQSHKINRSAEKPEVICLNTSGRLERHPPGVARCAAIHHIHICRFST